MHANSLCGQLKESIKCNGVIQILNIPEGDDFRLFGAINFLQVKNVYGFLTMNSRKKTSSVKKNLC